MRYFLFAIVGITLFLSAGCRSSELIIEVVGPNEAPLSGVRIEGSYQTRKSPADRMPVTDRFDRVTDDLGRIVITTPNYIDGVHVSIKHELYTRLGAKIKGFPGMPDRGFEPDSIEHPYTIEDVKSIGRNIIRFYLNVK
ncbi:MAG: hypothetical protein E3J72_15240 [Planctomycetota bacterium]|nr:MAG: hypothetical protein E3J72_15240 [Planctomycetota bacterium]